MPIKDLFSPFNENLVICDTSNGQYSNLNLNQNYFSNSFSESSKNVSTEERKDFYSVFVNDDSKRRKDSHSWNKLSKVNNDYGSEKEYGLKKAENNSSNSSTLSLHIKAYENSTEVNLFNETTKQKYGSFVKQIFHDSTSFIQNSFEFSRQQENEDEKMPEVSQFRASQKLHNFNQINKVNFRQPLPQHSEMECFEFGIEFVKDVAESYGIGPISESTANTISTHVNCLIKLLLIAARSNRIASGRLNFDVADLHVAAENLGIDISPTYLNFYKNGNGLVNPTEHLADSLLNNKIFGDVVLQPQWLVIEGEQPPTIQENIVPSFRGLELNNNNCIKKKEEPLELFEEAWKAKPKLEACLVRTKAIHQTTVEQQKFFKEIMEMMVSGDDPKQKKAMFILRSDPSIQLLIPRIVSFVANSIKGNIAQESLVVMTHLLLIVDCLIANPYINMEEDLHVLLPSIISILLFRSQNLEREGSYVTRKYAARVLFKIFKKHDLPNAQHRALNILSHAFRHSQTSFPSHVAIVFCFKLFGPEVIEFYLFQHLQKIKQLIGNYKPPKEFVESSRKQDPTKLGDALFEALFEYCKSPLMGEKTLDYCKQVFGPFGDDVFRRIKADNNGTITI